jgi:hypothetical protein
LDKNRWKIRPCNRKVLNEKSLEYEDVFEKLVEFFVSFDVGNVGFLYFF